MSTGASTACPPPNDSVGTLPASPVILGEDGAVDPAKLAEAGRLYAGEVAAIIADIRKSGKKVSAHLVEGRMRREQEPASSSRPSSWRVSSAAAARSSPRPASSAASSSINGPGTLPRCPPMVKLAGWCTRRGASWSWTKSSRASAGWASPFGHSSFRERVWITFRPLLQMARWMDGFGDAVPDLVTMGKPMGNGFPVAAVAVRAEVAAHFGGGMQYFNTVSLPLSCSTDGTEWVSQFGGNPVSCAAVEAVLGVLAAGGLVAAAGSKGAHLLQALRSLQKKHPSVVGDVRLPNFHLHSPPGSR